MATHLEATEKRIKRNFDNNKIGSISHTYEERTGSPRQTKTSKSIITKLAAINKLKSISFKLIKDITTVTGARIDRNKRHRAIWVFINWIKDGKLEHFHEIKLTDYLRIYRLNFGDPEITYEIKFGRGNHAQT